jgi:hypothetical protein
MMAPDVEFALNSWLPQIRLPSGQGPRDMHCDTQAGSGSIRELR